AARQVIVDFLRNVRVDLVRQIGIRSLSPKKSQHAHAPPLLTSFPIPRLLSSPCQSLPPSDSIGPALSSTASAPPQSACKISLSDCSHSFPSTTPATPCLPAGAAPDTVNLAPPAEHLRSCAQ